MRQQNLGECTRIPNARNTSRRITQDSKRGGQRGSRGQPHWLVSTANVAAFVTGFLRFPFQFLDSFRFPSLPFGAASLHRSALSILFRGPLRSARALDSANRSNLVLYAAILCSSACIHAGRSSSLQHPSQLSQNRSSHRRPQSLLKSKPPPPKWARDTFFRHSGSSPLLSTCRHVEVSAVDVHVVLIGFFFLSSPSSSHAKPLLLVVVLLQCAEIAAYVLFPYLGCLQNISLAIGDFKANESLVNVLRSSRSIITAGRWMLDVGRWTLDIEGLRLHVERWDIGRWNAGRWTLVAGRYYGGRWSTLYDRDVDDDGHPQGKMVT